MTRLAACGRCREVRELHPFREELRTHCQPCLQDLAEASLLSWLQLFSGAHVDPEYLGGLAFAVAMATLAKTSIDEADFLARARLSWQDSSPLAQLVRHVLEKKTHGNQTATRTV